MSRADTTTRIHRRVERHGVELDPSVVAALAVYYDLLQRWNTKVNLTALEDGEEALDRLIVEPVLAARWLPVSGLLMDVGSGGGSPAVPLKTCQPGLQLVMVESKTRKAAFLREVVRQLGLEGVRVEARRVEDLLINDTLKESADIVSVRAVRLDRRLLTKLAALTKPGGHLFLFSGPGIGAPGIDAPWSFSGELPLVATLGSRLLRLAKDVGPVVG
jgi:16S rRNA (guanine527-N7)-methyltransferase